MEQILEEKVCLELAPKKNYILSQGACFPLAVLRTEPIFVNWYYSNYMMPIAAWGGAGSPIVVEVADALSYGEGSNVYSKVMKISSIGTHVCSQINEVAIVLKRYICAEAYCALFLDFYYLKCSNETYEKNHYAHELLFYGYDDTIQIFNAYGYIDKSYRYVKISYTEVREAFKSALEYVTEGWERYMLVTMRLYYHGDDYRYPFLNKKFINKLTSYVESKVSEEFKCDNLMYLKTSDRQEYRVGVSITDILLEDIICLSDLLADKDSDEHSYNQQRAFNVYQAYHTDIYERLKYAAEVNGLENELQEYILSYHHTVVKSTDMIRMLYIKLESMISKNMPVTVVLDHISMLLKAVKENELLILKRYLDVFVAKNLPEEVLTSEGRYMD